MVQEALRKKLGENWTTFVSSLEEGDKKFKQGGKADKDKQRKGEIKGEKKEKKKRKKKGGNSKPGKKPPSEETNELHGKENIGLHGQKTKERHGHVKEG